MRSTAESSGQYSEYASEYSEEYYSEGRQHDQVRYSSDANLVTSDSRWESKSAGAEPSQNFAWVRITLDRAEGLRRRENGDNPDVVATVRSLSTIPS
jgi:hypothetical protein